LDQEQKLSCIPQYVEIFVDAWWIIEGMEYVVKCFHMLYWFLSLFHPFYHYIKQQWQI
jgi:hypothetical protein